MRNNNRVLWIIIGGLVLVVCLCVGVAGLLAAGLIVWNVQVEQDGGFPPEVTVEVIPETPTEQQIPLSTPVFETPDPTGEQEPTREVDPQTDATATPQGASPPSSADLPDEIAQQMDQIEAQVVELRGLQPQGDVERALLTREQLREQLIDDLEEDYSAEEAQTDARMLAAFGLLDPDFDLYDFYIELYSEQVGGFYDDETQEMYVVQDQDFAGLQRLTYAHEYTHALQDLTYDLENGLGYNDEACEMDSQRCSAVLSLVEGDASLLEIQWFLNYGTSQDQAEIQEFYENYESPVFDQSPAFIQEDFLFPYVSGQMFVEHLFDQGGWEAVDAAYRDLPASTEQILHPERYPADTPLPVDLPDLSQALGPGWEEIYRGVMGEWYTYLILAFGLDPQARLDEPEAQGAAEGWGGDAFVVYYNEESDETVMALRTVWDAESEAAEFASAFQEYASARFGSSAAGDGGQMTWESPQGRTEFRVSVDTTSWILAPNAEIAQIVQAEIESQ